MPDHLAHDLVADLAFAHHLADAADEVTMHHFRGELRVEQKPDGSDVSHADLATEERLRELIASRRPGDAVLGEEAGLAGDARRRWVLEPIDGTHAYIAGRPGWCGVLVVSRFSSAASRYAPSWLVMAVGRSGDWSTRASVTLRFRCRLVGLVLTGSVAPLPLTVATV